MRFFTLLLFVSLLFSACRDSNYGTNIDNELVPYYESFRDEAAKRGVVFDIEEEGIEGYIQAITTEGGIAGLCNPENHGQTSIIVDGRVWKTVDERTKEYIVFHELGHCFLDRPHIEDDPTKINTSACESIMFSGGYRFTGSSCLDLYLADYSDEKRSELLDELFR